MPGIITPNFPFAGCIEPLCFDLPGLVVDGVSFFTSIRAVLGAAFADLFLVAIFLAASSVTICMDVQTLYVLVSGGSFANRAG
jgi:hypothetical protein